MAAGSKSHKGMTSRSNIWPALEPREGTRAESLCLGVGAIVCFSENSGDRLGAILLARFTSCMRLQKRACEPTRRASIFGIYLARSGRQVEQIGRPSQQAFLRRGKRV